MSIEIKVHPLFFREFATKTWISPNEIIKELVENAFDEDATKIVITLTGDGSIIIEDDAGMDEKGMEKFLILGSPHKRSESISPIYKRIRTGRYGTGKLSFLTSFERMIIRTRREDFAKSFLIDGNSLDNLFKGNSKLQEIIEEKLGRNGTEIRLEKPKVNIDMLKLTKEIRKLAILRQPMFEVYIKKSEKFKEWSIEDSFPIKAPEIQGHKIPVNLDNSSITGEIIIAKRPLGEDEKGIAIMVGNHIVNRSNFGFDNKLNRVTGFVRCNYLTSRFADKSAIIEDENYNKFLHLMRDMISENVMPSLTKYEDVLITKEESKIYREIDNVLGQAIVESLEVREEIEGFETVDIKIEDNENSEKIPEIPSSISIGNQVSEIPDNNNQYNKSLVKSKELDTKQDELGEGTNETKLVDSIKNDVDISNENNNINISNINNNGTEEIIKKIRKPIVKKTFALRKIGYKVIPYEDESDQRYSFTNNNIVFVNKANSTYRAEAVRGDEFLLRHIIRIVAEAITQTKHPEAREALELQNKLVAEAIRIHNISSKR